MTFLFQVSLVPNGLDAIPTTISEPSSVLLEKLGLAGSKVIAYIGSFALYEGLEDLFMPLPALVKRGLMPVFCWLVPTLPQELIHPVSRVIVCESWLINSVLQTIL